MTKTTENEQLFVRPRTVEVRSATDPKKTYTVTLPYCPCYGFNFRGECSHVLTAMAEFSGGETVAKRKISTAS